MALNYTVPGLDKASAEKIIDLLQVRLSAYNDLHLTLKHAHWNVVGTNFIAVHEMLDPQVELVRGYADEIAERIAALGGSPNGTPGAIVRDRTWDDYAVNRAGTLEHIAGLNRVYDGVISDNRSVIAATDDLDLVTQDLVIGQTAELEKFQWFLRAHLEDGKGNLADADSAEAEAPRASALA